MDNFEQEDLQLASFSDRTLAYLIDDFLVSCIFLAVIWEQIMSQATQEAIIEYISQASIYMIFLRIIYQSFFVAVYGASIGKMIMKIRIIYIQDLSKPNVFISVVRACVRVLSIMAFGLGFLWAAGNPLRQTWHDKFAKTVVVNA